MPQESPVRNPIRKHLHMPTRSRPRSLPHDRRFQISLPTGRMRCLIPFIAATTALASNIQVNYYYDAGCSDYAVEVDNVPTDCFTWGWRGSNSANIAKCVNPATGQERQNGCQCQYYTQPNCQGPSEYRYWIDYGFDPSCASNPSQGFQSFQCGG